MYVSEADLLRTRADQLDAFAQLTDPDAAIAARAVGVTGMPAFLIRECFNLHPLANSLVNDALIMAVAHGWAEEVARVTRLWEVGAVVTSPRFRALADAHIPDLLEADPDDDDVEWFGGFR